MHHFHGSITKMHQKSQKVRWARPGFEPGTTRTLSEYHTPRPTSHVMVTTGSKILNKVIKIFIKFSYELIDMRVGINKEFSLKVRKNQRLTQRNVVYSVLQL